MAVETERQPLADLNMLPLHSHHAHQRPWYARRNVQGAAVAGLAICCLLVFVLAGPGPKITGDITSDAPVDTRVAAAQQAQRERDGGSARADADANCDSSKVEVGFFGESLCPDCQHMVLDVLAPMFENGVAKLMDLKYHAFGNVRNASDGSYAYQHGPAEGKFNRYILCAQHLHPKQEEWFPYVSCFAKNMRSLDAQADSCAQEQGWDAAEVSSCAEGEGGKELERTAAALTWALRPAKNFVPWMVVNGVAIGNEYDKLERYVCTASRAKTKPEACYTMPESMQYQG